MKVNTYYIASNTYYFIGYTQLKSVAVKNYTRGYYKYIIVHSIIPEIYLKRRIISKNYNALAYLCILHTVQ